MTLHDVPAVPVTAHTSCDSRGNVGVVGEDGKVGPSSHPHLSPTDPHSRVRLTSPDPEDPLSSYINANYIRVCSSIPRVFH